MKTLVLTVMLIAVAALAGCASTPMNRTVLRAHAERNCRVEAATTRTYAISSTGVGMRNVGYEKCMRHAGFATR